MRIDLVKSSLKKLVEDNESTLVDGLAITEKVTQWSIEQLTTSIFTVPEDTPFIGISVRPTAKSYRDSSKAGILASAGSISALIDRNLYDVEIRVIVFVDSISGEIVGGDQETFETVNAMFDLLVARTVLMLRDNAEFSSDPAGFTLKLETESGRESTQEITVTDFSNAVVWGTGQERVASLINSIRFRLETCGEPRAYPAP